MTEIKAKYKNKKVFIEGLWFDSAKEGRRYCQLVVLAKKGLISGLETQKKFELVPAAILDGRKKTAMRYFSDFYYFDETKKQWIVEDTKSIVTRKNPLYRAKKHMMKAFLGMDITET